MSTRTQAGPWRRIRRALISSLPLLFFAQAEVHAQDSLSAPSQRAQLPLFSETQQSFSGTLAAREYFVQLPEHIVFRDGSELQVMLHPALELMPHLCALSVAINDRTLSSTNLDDAARSGLADPIIFHVGVPEEVLVPGWNKISLQFVLRPIPGTPRLPGERAIWTVRRAESYLSVAFARLPLFAALARFPQSFAEEQLLQPDTEAPLARPPAPALAILIPGRSAEAHLRAAAIVAARLGQLSYLAERHCHLDALESWKMQTDRSDAVIIGRREQLGGAEFPSDVAGALVSLGAGRGLLAEFFRGPSTNQHRVLLVSGADDAGLEKAALNLGSSPALMEALPHPAVIERAPEISAELEAQARPSPKRVRLSEGAPIQLRGLYRSEQSISNWRLPPGFQLGPDSALHLQFTQSPLLLKERSVLEVLVNGDRIGTLPFGAATASPGSVRLPLPRGLPCRDPMTLTFRALLDLGEVDCAQRQEENAWVNISSDSTVETTIERSSVDGLNQLQQFLLGDPFARQAAFLVPASPSLEQVRVLFALWLELGRNLPSAPVLWPEVVTYHRGGPPNAARLRGRSVLLLGAVADWPDALPAGAGATALRMTSPDSRIVKMQSRHYEVADFDPTLVFAQMLPSPWSKGETLVLAGGWVDYATAALKRLLLDPASVAQLYGNLVALDSLGRGAAYDLHRISSESFAERIQRRIPPGLSVEESARRVARQEARSTTAQQWNWILFLGFGALLVLLVLSRLGLMWEQVRLRKKSRRTDGALEGTT